MYRRGSILSRMRISFVLANIQDESKWRLSGKAGYKTAKCEYDYK